MNAAELVTLAELTGRAEDGDIVVLAERHSYAVLRRMPGGALNGLHGMDAERAIEFVRALQRAEPTQTVVDAYLASVKAGLDLGPRGDL